MIDFKKLLDLNFWFALRPNAPTERTVLAAVAVFAAFLVLAFVLRILARVKKQNLLLVKLLKKISKLFSTMALVGFVLLFFSYEQIYLLGSRFWFLLWFAGIVVWVVFIALYAVRKMPKEKNDMEKKKKFLKYLV